MKVSDVGMNVCTLCQTDQLHYSAIGQVMLDQVVQYHTHGHRHEHLS